MAGLYYEELDVGAVIEHAITRTVTESDNILFSTMTMNPQPLHIDRHYAETQSEFKEPLVNSLLTLGMMVGISVHETTLGTTIANLGMTDVRFPNPVFQGDTLRITSEVASKRESRSRPEAGIVEFVHRAYTQDGTCVAECRRQALMKRRATETP